MRREGKRIRTEHLELRALASLLPHPRVGIIVPRFKHSAVDRNRLKRRLRELARTRLIPALGSGSVDLVIRVLPPAYDATFDSLERQLRGTTDRLARITPKAPPRSPASSASSAAAPAEPASE